MVNWEKWLLSPSLYSWQIVALTHKLNPNEIQNSYDYPSWSLIVPNAIHEDFESRLSILDTSSYSSYFVTSHKPPQVRTLECYRWVIENTKWIDLEDSFYLPLKEYLLKKGGIAEEPNTINQSDKPLGDVERTNLLRIVGALLELNKDEIKTNSQAELIRFLEEAYPNTTPFKESTLESYFSKANKALKNSS